MKNTQTTCWTIVILTAGYQLDFSIILFYFLCPFCDIFEIINQMCYRGLNFIIKIIKINSNSEKSKKKQMIKLVESFLGFKSKKSIILQQRNSILKLLLIMNIPSIIILLLVNKYVPEVYMDQYFHFAQFKQYHEGNYQVWDSKITTPPGLYHLQVGLSYIFGSSLEAMRTINALIFANLFLVFAMKIYEFNDHNVNNISRSLNLALTPTIFFFNFLDYTDTASLTFITMAYYYCQVGSAWRMGISSLLSVYIRQNNIIWCMYLLLYRIINMYASGISNIRGNLVRSTAIFIKLLLVNSKEIIIKNFIQILIFPIFFLYLYRYNNGKLVFGDHENHQVSFHPTQFLYLTFFLLLNVPITISDIIVAVRQSFNRLYFSRHALSAYLFLLSASIVIVDKCSIVHPFILADNRHYVFYIYRYFKWFKYPMCAVYPFCLITLLRIIVNSSQKLVKFILWSVVSMLYLMLTPLVEVRYFTIPFVILAFEIRNRCLSFDIEKLHKSEAREDKGWANRMIFPTIFKIAINLFLFYMFLFRPFGDLKQNRFIW